MRIEENLFSREVRNQLIFTNIVLFYGQSDCKLTHFARGEQANLKNKKKCNKRVCSETTIKTTANKLQQTMLHDDYANFARFKLNRVCI